MQTRGEAQSEFRTQGSATLPCEDEPDPEEPPPPPPDAPLFARAPVPLGRPESEATEPLQPAIQAAVAAPSSKVRAFFITLIPHGSILNPRVPRSDHAVRDGGQARLSSGAVRPGA